MTQDEFVAKRQRDWQELDRLLLAGDGPLTREGSTISRMASLYRALCTDLMRCRAARYTPDLSGYLDGLAGRAHAALYGVQPFRTPAVLAFFTRDFPRALRANAAGFWLSFALFFVPFAIGLAGALASTDLATKVLPPSHLQALAEMHSGNFGRGLGADTKMAGFYVLNNVGIAFRCFATGILFGLGSLFYLFYNGLVTGVSVGYVMAVGNGVHIWTFMCTHLPFELGAIVIAGGAGLQMGYALVDTGGLTRVGSLRRAAPVITRQVLGAAAMLFIAAAIEGFWSPSAIPPPVKWSAAILNTVLIALYLSLAGRGKGARA